MNIRTWLAIQWPFSTKMRVVELSGYELVKLVRIANNREAFRNVR